MATTKNKKKKKSRRYLTRAARRTVAALLMISALIVAAIPATPSRAAEDGNGEAYSGAAGDPVTIQVGDNLLLYCAKTAEEGCVQLNYITKIDPAKKADTVDISGSLTGNDGLTYKCTVIAGNALTDPRSADVFNDVTSFTANDVITIGSGAFQGCPNLSQFKGNSVKVVEGTAFKDCASLGNCSLNQGEDGVTSIGDSAFENSGLSSMPETPSISYIGNYAFKNSNIKSSITVKGPSDLSDENTIKLMNGVFENCTQLQNVKIEGNYNAIGIDTFAGCTLLTGVEFPDTLAEIGSGSFTGCTKLETINIPSKVATLESGLFADCSSLKELTLKNGPEFISGKVNDTKIEGALPSSPNEKFHIKGYRLISSGGTEDYTKAYNYCLEKGYTYQCIDDDGGVASQYFDVTNDGVLVNCNANGYIANKTTGDSNTIVVPDQINGTAVTAIGSTAFQNVDSSGEVITNVTLSSAVTNIYSGAFSNMNNLKSVTMTNNRTTVIEDDENKDKAFPVRDGFFIYGVISTSTTAEGLNAYEYAMKYGIEFRGSGKYSDESGEVTLIVEGDKKLSAVAENGDKDGGAVYTHPKIEAVRIPSGIEEISDTLFYQDKVLTSFAADSEDGVDGESHGLKKLAAHQFENCSSLTNVSLPGTVYDFGALPFKNCASLKEIVIPESPYCAFESGVLYGPSTVASANTSVVASVGEKPAEDTKFRIVEMLEYSDTKAYTVPSAVNGKAVNEISEAAFSNNQNLQRFSTTGSEVTIIPKDCFKGAQSIARITFADIVEEVREGAFQQLGSNNVSSKQPVFYVNSPYLTYESKSGVFYYEESSSSDVPYYFKSTAKNDTTAKLCGINTDSSDTKDNLYWTGLVSEETETKKALSSCSIVYRGTTSDDGTYAIRKYTGSEIDWVPGTATSGDFYVMDGNTILTNGTDYTMNSMAVKPKDIGTYTFTLTGTGDYEGTLTGTIRVTKDGSSGGGDDPTPTPTPTDTGDFVTDFSYDGPGFFKWTGSTIMPQNIVVRSASNNDIILTKNVDYTISYGDSTHDNKSMGINMGLVTINGIGNYKGKTGKSYFSIKKSLSENIVGNPTPPGKTIDVTISNGVYDSNNAVSANIVLIDRTTGKTLTEGVDYTVTCTKISGKNQAIATITGMGDYYYDTYVSSRFAITKKKSSSSGSTSSSSGSSSSSSSSSGSSSSSSGSSSSSSSGSSSSSSSAGSSSAGGNYSRNTTSGSTVTRTSGGTVRAATDDELANLLQAAHIDAINGGTADGYQVRISKTDSAESAFSQALVNRYGSLDNVRYYSMDIELLDENGNYVDSSGVTVTMTLPLPDSLASYGANNRVATVDGSGNLEDLGVTYSMLQGRECATFVAPHFSPYGFYVDVANLDYGVMDSTPKTGDPISPKWFFSLGLAALSIFLFLKKDPKPKANPA